MSQAIASQPKSRDPARLSKLHHVLLDLIRSLPNYPRIKVLELSCGDAYLLEIIAEDGAQVAGTTFLAGEDYIRTREHPPSMAIHTGVDLNGPLPFDDELFDLVYSIEVVEHVELHSNFISECARLIRPGGHFLFTTPNTHRLISRAQFFISGMPHIKRELIPWDVSKTQMYAFHHRCIDFPLVHWMMWQNRLRIQRVAETWVLWPSRLLSLFGPFMRSMSERVTRRRSGGGVSSTATDSQADVDGRADMLRWLTSRPGMLSEHWCVLAKKIK